MRRRKTKFPTVKPLIYLPKCQIWMQLSPKWMYLFKFLDVFGKELKCLNTKGKYSTTKLYSKIKLIARIVSITKLQNNDQLSKVATTW